MSISPKAPAVVEKPASTTELKAYGGMTLKRGLILAICSFIHTALTPLRRCH
jgi:hypothetical protein